MRRSSRCAAIRYRAAAAPPSQPAGWAADIELGYNAERTHAVIDLEECPILLPQIAIRVAASQGRFDRRHALQQRGEDFCHGSGQRPRLRSRGAAIARLPRRPSSSVRCGAAGFIRASWNGELVLLAAQPFVSFGGVESGASGPNAFLQAVEACERDMADWVLDALSQAHAASGPICDLFAGLGAFTFPGGQDRSLSPPMRKIRRPWLGSQRRRSKQRASRRCPRSGATCSAARWDRLS